MTFRPLETTHISVETAGPREERTFVVLEGIRGLAALMIFMRHLPSSIPHPRCDDSYMAVDLFFILSGFVLHAAYGRQLRLGSLSLSRFLTLRLVRLVPCLVIAAVLAVLAELPELMRQRGWACADVLAAILSMVGMPWPFVRTTVLFPANPPEWSLHFELIANVAFAVAMRWIHWRILRWAIAVAGVLLIQRIICYGHIDLGTHRTQYTSGLIRVCWGFGIGVALHRGFASLQGRGSGQWALSSTAATIAALLIAGVVLSMPTLASRKANAGMVVCWCIGVLPLMVVVPACLQTPSFLLRRMCLILGRLSYPLYICHWPMLIGGLALVRHAHLSQRAGALLIVVSILGSSGAIAVLLDEPVRRWLRVWLRRKTVSKEHASVAA